MGKKTIDLQRGMICDRTDNHHFRFFSSLSDNPVFNDLTPTAQMLYLRMGLSTKGKLEFEFPYSRYKRYMSKATFQTAKQQLIDGGFITETKYRCSKNRYRLSNEWLNKKMPSTGGKPADGNTQNNERNNKLYV